MKWAGPNSLRMSASRMCTFDSADAVILTRTTASSMRFRRMARSTPAVGSASCGFHRYVDGHERAGLQSMKLERGHALALGGSRVQVDHAETLVIVLLAEIDSLQAARIDHHGRSLAQHLVFVDVPERDVVQLRKPNGAGQ